MNACLIKFTSTVFGRLFSCRLFSMIFLWPTKILNFLEYMSPLSEQCDTQHYNYCISCYLLVTHITLNVCFGHIDSFSLLLLSPNHPSHEELHRPDESQSSDIHTPIMQQAPHNSCKIVICHVLHKTLLQSQPDGLVVWRVVHGIESRRILHHICQDLFRCYTR